MCHVFVRNAVGESVGNPGVFRFTGGEGTGSCDSSRHYNTE